MFNCYLEDDKIMIVSAEGILDYDLIAEDIIEKIKKLLPESTKKEIVFAFGGEPFNPHFYNKIFYVIPKIVNANLGAKIKIETAINPIDENVELYKKMCEVNQWTPVEISFFNRWESAYGKNLSLRDLSEEYNPKKRNKVFLTLNNGFRPNRLQFIAELIKNDLLNLGYVSFLCDHGNQKEIITNFLLDDNHVKKYLPMTYTSVKDTIMKNIDSFPLVLDYDPRAGDRTDWLMKHQHSSDALINFYNDSYLSVVNETVFYTHSNTPGEYYDGYLFSDKIWKPISFKQPFILASSRYSLEMFRKSGYKTFHPFINEDYDAEYGENRILAIIEELKRLSKFTDDEWLEWQQNVKPIVDYNHNKLKNATLIEKIYYPDK